MSDGTSVMGDSKTFMSDAKDMTVASEELRVWIALSGVTGALPPAGVARTLHDLS